MTDTGAYTDVMFGIFHLLGFQFSPRLADIGGARFWQVDGKADYGALDHLAAQRVNTAPVAEHWEDLPRLAGSLKLGTVLATGLIRSCRPRSVDQAGSRPRGTRAAGQAIYLLRYIDDEAYRRRILMQLNRGEGRHQLARIVFQGSPNRLLKTVGVDGPTASSARIGVVDRQDRGRP